MSWILLVAVVAALALALFTRRRDLDSMRANLREVELARERGSARARLQHPHIDGARCIGCGLCVEACPEEGVLALVHDQAVVAHGARCVGHGRCAEECPVGAIALTLGDLSQRRDIPVLDEKLEVPGSPGLFLAGEVTGFALVRTAIGHGTAVAEEVARRAREHRGRRGRPHAQVRAEGERRPYDLLIVGAGPAGIACALQAKKDGLAFAVIEQAELGGTVAKYPRRKLVMTQPVDLPLHGRLTRTSYTKEELIELWRELTARYELPIHTGCAFTGLARQADGTFEVACGDRRFSARNVCLALGRRGTPNKLGVAGEELSKVTYGLLDAHAFTGRRILVVGGGDSAVEAALGLAEQPGNAVTLSYRRPAFTRLKARNESRLARALQTQSLTALMASEVVRIDEAEVALRLGDGGSGDVCGLPNDDVFILAGGTPPFDLLERCGVSFDPARRSAPAALASEGTGLGYALAAALALALGALVWSLAFWRYYELPLHLRPDSDLHGWLRPAGRVGLAFGIASAALIAANLAYLARRSGRWRFEWGSLRTWMTVHVATGVGALVLALVHGAMAPRNTVGGHALAGLAVLVATGALGRYFYAFVPRAANGRELALEEVRGKLAALAGQWDRGRGEFGERVQREVQALVEAGHWHGSLARRLRALATSERALRRTLERLDREGRAEGIPDAQLRELFGLARTAHRTAIAAAHFEDLRALLSSWRYLHRWIALLTVLLVALHVFVSLRFSSFLTPGSAP